MDEGICGSFEDELALGPVVVLDGADESADAELLLAVRSCGLDEKTTQRLGAALTGHVVHRRRCEWKAARWRQEAATLQGVLEHLMESRADLDDRVTKVEEDVAELEEEIRAARDLGDNINEECQMIQGELERLTQVLFEEVNLMVSTEARAKHAEMVSAQELEREMARVRENLSTMSRRFGALKARLHSSGKLVKQMSEPRIKSGGLAAAKKASRLSNLTQTGSSKALDEILRSALSETDDGK